MKTKIVIDLLRYWGNHCDAHISNGEYQVEGSVLLKNAALKIERLCEDVSERNEKIGKLKKNNRKLRKELAERKTAGWISVEDEPLPVLSGEINMMWHMYPKDLPAYIAFYGNGANNGVTHWMTLEPPKPKVKTYTDVYLDRMKEAFPEAVLDGSVTGKCRDKLFGINKPCTYQCRDCWNQPYPEEEGEAE